MFISTLYGPERHNVPVMQRFGPINSAHGHRRLNVLFSRAKSRIVTYTSMDPGDIKVDEKKAKGVRMFRAWLEYSGSGQLPENHIPKGSTDSPFEDHVIRVIESLGFEAVPQVGVAGFRIDIGVRHPDWPYGFVLGVECDGATYHSSCSARDRDRLREEVLRSRGWKLHRIWSTDWFSNASGERARLKRVIEQQIEMLLESRVEKAIDLPSIELVEVPIADNRSRPETSNSSLLQDNPLNNGIEGAPSLNPINWQHCIASEASSVRTVSVGDKVRLRKLDETGEEMMVTLSSVRNSPEDGLISLATPLGEAILDAEEGEEIEYQVGAYIRKVKVVSFATESAAEILKADGGSWKGKSVELPHGTEIRMEYGGIWHEGRIENGYWLVNGERATAPSAAASVVADGTFRNGWHDWQVKRPGDSGFRLLDTLISPEDS